MVREDENGDETEGYQMTAKVIGTRLRWAGERDDDGHRTYALLSFVECTTKDDGPAVVMACPDLPQVGDTWNFGNDSDSWAFCYPYMKADPKAGIRDGEPFRFWQVAQKFSTRPLKRCQTTQVENPLDEPMRISGNFCKYTKEVYYDRFGNPIRTSSFERIFGPGVEFDANRASVRVEFNVASIDIHDLASYVDTVNDSTLWGFPRRCVKLSNIVWERKMFGICSYYYTRALEFDTNWETFDRNVLDEGHKCLHGQWALDASDPNLTAFRAGDPLPPGSLWKLLPINGSAPNRNNPQHYTRYKDRHGEVSKVILDGRGEPASLGEPSLSTSASSTSHVTGSGTPGNIFVTYYPESNMFNLGVPTTL